MTLYVAPVVEGHAETRCVERLLHRIWNEVLVAPLRLQVLPVVRGNRAGLVANGRSVLATKVREALTALSPALRKDRAGRGLVLLLIDAEEDCAATIGPDLRTRVRATAGNIDATCVLAVRMLENWFKAAAASLAGVNELPADLTTPDDPEAGSGDTWLKEQFKRVRRNRTYKKTTDAPEFAKAMDLAECHRNSRSFRQLCKELGARVPAPDPG